MIVSLSPRFLSNFAAAIVNCLIFSISSGAAPSCKIKLIYIFFTSALDGLVLDKILSTRGSLELKLLSVTSIGFFVSTDITGGFGSSAFFEALFEFVKSISNPGIGNPTE